MGKKSGQHAIYIYQFIAKDILKDELEHLDELAGKLAS